jgi:hypothetical protein
VVVISTVNDVAIGVRIVNSDPDKDACRSDSGVSATATIEVSSVNKIKPAGFPPEITISGILSPV